MGSTESTLQSMDGPTGDDNGNSSANNSNNGTNDNNNNRSDDNNARSNNNNTSDNISNSNNTSTSESRARRPQRQRRREPSPTPAASSAEPNRTDDDQWWWEIENENLILDQVPSAAVTLCPSEPENGSESKAASEGQDPGERQAKEGEEEPKQTLEEFKQELSVKRLARQSAVQDLRDEITSLRSKLASEQERNRRLRRSTSSGAATPCGEDAPLEEGACGGRPTKDDEVEDADDANPMSRGRHANIELANAQLALQLANADNLTVRTELGVVKRQVVTLKEVITCCKQMLAVKEEQCDQLKAKLSEIENSFSEREMHIMSSNLRQEYERQLVNMRQLRQLYEERQRVAAAEHENLQRLISIKRDELVAEQEKTKNFEEHNQTLMKELESVNNELAKMREECNEHKFEKKTLKEEMEAVNTLFSQMVMGFNGKNNVDIDRLTTMLEENRTLLNDIANKEGNCTDGATLPKLLFELVEQASRADNPKPLADNDPDAPPGDQLDVPSTEEALLQRQQQQHQQRSNKMSSSRSDNVADAGDVAVDETDGHDGVGVGGAGVVGDVVDDGGRVARRYRETEVIGKVASAQEIIGNLPKVWKVLMELLSHHKIEQVQFAENGNGEDCYKSVETPNGLKAELSVSKTYIKLKDLILEKKSLVKETSRLKSLNCHLEYRLNEQEKRLSAVSLELTKTWHLVGKMQRQHRQLHTQEQILRYQLQQKRRLLSELKDELEYCRRKWAVARAKNDESQEQYNDLRREFAQRKLDDSHNSAESGYSDSGPASGGEDDEVLAVGGAAGGAGAIGGDGGGGGEAAAPPSTSGSTASCGSRRKYLKEMFEHTRKIKRMQSTSPGRAAAARGIGGEGEREGEEIVLRWNSAPPSCGDDDDDSGDLPPRALLPLNARQPSSTARNSGRGSADAETEADADAEAEFEEPGTSSSHTRRTGATVKGTNNNDEQREERATRIHRLEEQCKTLIQQVLETSDNRERLEIQLCRFQDEIAPVQYAVPLDELLKSKRLDRMTRASSAPAPGCLTPREEEYTRKRSERLERLEEESRQLMSRIKRTSDRGHYLRCSLDRLRRAPSSREGSFESNTEDESAASKDLQPRHQGPVADGAEVDEEEEPSASNVLTEEEKAYMARRSTRLQRLEDESKQLMNQLSRNSSRGEAIASKLDKLHEKSVSQEAAPASPTSPSPSIEQRMENIEKISSNRDERLAILEEEGKQLLSRLTNTSDRGSAMIQRIADRQAARRAASAAANAQGLESENDTATVLMPPLSNVACSSIVGEELNERVTVTTTASRIAAQPQPETEMARPEQPLPSTGAIRKTRPLMQLSASARSKKATKATVTSVAKQEDGEEESLEAMVRRLRELPFPSEAQKQMEKAEQEEKEQNGKKEEHKEENGEQKDEENEQKEEKESQKEQKEVPTMVEDVEESENKPQD